MTPAHSLYIFSENKFTLSNLPKGKKRNKQGSIAEME